MKKRVFHTFAGFLALMLAFTFLSRAADSLSVAKVSVQRAGSGKVPHKVTGSGKVVQNREWAVSTLAGQVVKSIYVEEGQKVKKGELLFEIDLDILKEQVLDKKQEMKKTELQAQDRASSRAAEAARDAVSQNHAAGDYYAAAEKGNVQVGRAAQELSSAKKKLEMLNNGGEEEAGGDSVEAVLKEACEEKKQEYEKAVKYKEELEEAVEKEVQRALKELSGGNAVQTAGGTDTARLVRAEQEMLLAAEALPDGREAENTPQSMEPPSQKNEAEANVPQTGETASETEMPQTDETVPEMSMPETNTLETDPAEINTPEIDALQTDGIQDENELIIGGETEAPSADPWLLEQQIRQKNQALLDEAQVQINIKQAEMQEADAALAQYREEKAAGIQTGRQEMKEQLLEEIRAKEQAYEDAVMAAGDSLRQAQRAVDDANAPKGTDSTGEIDAITREQEELQLKKLETLLENEGKVTAPIDATVTKVNLTTGERTPDGTAVMLSDTQAGNKLVVQVPAEQEKYIARGDAVTVKANNKDNKTLEGLTVDNVSVNEGDKEILDVTIQLPADVFETGTVASMESVRVSETYQCRIPLQALYQENSKYYVYVIAEQKTVLGMETTASRLDVDVLDKNETDAALQPGTLSSEQQVITSSDKPISDGSRVRLKGE